MLANSFRACITLVLDISFVLVEARDSYLLFIVMAVEVCTFGRFIIVEGIKSTNRVVLFGSFWLVQASIQCADDEGF